MAKSKINLKALQDKIKDLPAKTAVSCNRDVAQTLKEKFLSLIAKGLSPIEGNGRFPEYKNPKRYPGLVRDQFPSKRKRPVNLFLSGKFLRDFRAFVSKINVITYGFTSQYAKELELEHRIGKNGQPKRPTIPNNEEKLVKTIETAILKIYRKSVDDYLKK